MKVFLYVVACAACVALAAGEVSAETLLERYEGTRTADVNAVLAPLRTKLQARGVIADPAKIRERLPAIPLSTRGNPKLTEAQLVDELELGWRAWLHGDLGKAASQLDSATRLGFANPLLVVGDTKVRAALTRGIAGLALARSRLGETAAAATAITELINTGISLAELRELHPELAKLYLPALNATKNSTKYTLTVRTTDKPLAQIFVNEVRVPTKNGSYSAQREPGTYRILILAEDKALRYDVVVGPKDATLAVSVDFDRRLVVAADWVGLEMSLRPATVKSDASTFADQIQDSRVVVASASRAPNARYRVSLARFDRGTNTLVERSVDLLPTEPAKLDELVTGLFNTPTPAAVATGDTDAPADTPLPAGPEDTGPRPSLRAHLLIVGGLATLGVGALLVSLDEDPSRDGDSTYRDTAPAGIAVAAGGLVMFSLGLADRFWPREQPRKSAPTVTLGTGHVGVGWVGRF